MLRKRKELELSYSSNDDNNNRGDIDSEEERRSLAAARSDRMIESSSLLYSRSVYPVSLGLYEDD
jgi:hypothetical protein